MFQQWVMVFAVLLACTVGFAADPADFYVSPTGNDQASGKADAPFATIARAQEAVRAMRSAQPDRKTPVVVAARGGPYYLAKTIELTPADSGSADSPTVFQADGADKPLFSGGVRITGWKKDPQGRWTVQLPDVAAGQWSFVQLFVNGERRFRPRLPKDGYYIIADKMEPTEKFAKKGYDRFKYAGDDIQATWANLGDVEAQVTHTWTMSRFRIASVDPQQKVLTFTGATRHLQPWASMPKGNRYLIENVKEALGKPGEWYLDRPTGVLTYIPMPGEDIDKAEVIAPRIETLVQFTGDVANKKWVSHVVLRGLSFAHGNWVTPPEGNSFAQAEVQLGGAIAMAGARTAPSKSASCARWASTPSTLARPASVIASKAAS